VGLYPHLFIVVFIARAKNRYLKIPDFSFSGKDREKLESATTSGTGGMRKAPEKSH